MENESSRNLKLGIFLFAGIIGFFVAIYFIGNKKNIFGDSVTVVAKFRNVNGLQPGNNIQFSGINVGSVDKIHIRNDSTVLVEFSVDESIVRYMHKDAVASIGTDGLMGDKLVNLTSGTPDFPMLREYDTIFSLQPVNLDQMMRTLEVSNENLSEITTDLKFITRGVSDSRGTVWMLLTDTTLAANLRDGILSLKVAGKLTEQAGRDITTVTSEFRKGEGILHTLVKDSVLNNKLKRSIENFETGSEHTTKITENLVSITSALDSGKGTAAIILKDTVTGNNVKKSIENLQSGTAKFEENMDALRKNFLLRRYFKRKAKKEGK